MSVFPIPATPVPEQVRRGALEARAEGRVTFLSAPVVALLAESFPEPERLACWLADLATEVQQPIVTMRAADRGDATVFSFVGPAGWSEEKVAGFAGGLREKLESLCEPPNPVSAPWARPFRLDDPWGGPVREPDRPPGGVR